MIEGEQDSCVRAGILQALNLVDAEESVRVVYACESGSRAWGFPSTDSDYDVRFIYVHLPEWYLSVFEKRDVIERPFTDCLDLSGWDIKKALQLLRKSNPPLLEWLGSPIVYSSNKAIIERLKDLVPLFYSPMSCRYHYLSMAKNNFRSYLQGTEVLPKKYFYVLRPLLAIRWIDAGLGFPPTEFGTLLEGVSPGIEFQHAVAKLLEDKKSGGEIERMPRIEPISVFIEAEFERVENIEMKAQKRQHSDELLNEAFRWILTELGRASAPVS